MTLFIRNNYKSLIKFVVNTVIYNKENFEVSLLLLQFGKGELYMPGGVDIMVRKC